MYFVYLWFGLGFVCCFVRELETINFKLKTNMGPFWI